MSNRREERKRGELSQQDRRVEYSRIVDALDPHDGIVAAIETYRGLK